MRKYLIGILIGAALTITSSAFADDIKSLIGKSIQGEFPVSVNGESLDKKAIVIDGTSFLPVKAVGDSLNLDVSFDKKTGISLKEKEIAKEETLLTTPEPTNTPTPSTQTTPTTNKLTLEELELRIKDTNVSIYLNELTLKSGNQNTENSEKTKAIIEKQKSELADLERQKAALQ